MELLIVIGLIGLLMGLLLPTMMRVRFTQAKATCASNLHQVGVGVWNYAINSSASLPTHYVSAEETFDTLMMCKEDDDLVNLGLVAPYILQIQPFYCPSQTASTSPSLACDTPENAWLGPSVAIGTDGPAVVLADLGRLPPQAMGKPPIPKEKGPGKPAPGVNSSFAARCRDYPPDGVPSWKIHNYASQVIYSDFLGVDEWPGKGRFKKQIMAPHEAEGCNRLFGSGSVQWAGTAPLEAKRPVGNASPKAKDLYEYYRLLDVLP